MRELPAQPACGGPTLTGRSPSVTGDARTRAAALASVRGNLCDEPLLDERHAFSAEWLRNARALPATGGAEPAELAGAARSLGLDPAQVHERSPDDQNSNVL